MRETADFTVHEAPMGTDARTDWMMHARGLAIAVAAALIFSLAGAFDTSAIPILPRTVFWLIVMLLGAMLGVGAFTGVRVWGGLLHKPFLEGSMVSGLILVPQTFLVVGTTALFFGPKVLTIDRLGNEIAAVVMLTIAMTAMNYLTDHRSKHPAPVVGIAPPGLELPHADAEQRQSQPRLSERLPLRLRSAAIRALEAEDHYVRVHTDAGSELLLVRMSDAIAELDGAPGARTHRSWWVARNAVTTIRKVGNRRELLIGDNIVVPVSRSALPVLQQDGWFDGC